MMAERRNGGKPRREEKNKTSVSVNERKRQTHSRKYDVTGGEKQIKTGSKGKNVQGKTRQAHSSQYKPNPNSKCPISICAVAVSMWICHMSSSLLRNRSI